MFKAKTSETGLEARPKPRLDITDSYTGSPRVLECPGKSLLSWIVLEMPLNLKVSWNARRQVLLFFPIISYNFEPSYKFLYFYKIPIISYKLDIAGIFSTRMHQNEYLFSKIFRGSYPRTPDLYRDPAVMPTLHAVLSQLAHCNAPYV